jgi:hypothetical protein
MTNARAVLSGRVLDALGHPVSGARLFVRKAPGPVPDIALLTGEDGSFTLSLPTWGRYELACSSDVLGIASAAVEVGASNDDLVMRFAKA